MKPLIMGVTGASGGLYARSLARRLADQNRHIDIIVSPTAKSIMSHELELGAFSLEAFLGQPANNVVAHDYDDMNAVVASGSYAASGMVICPCSCRTLAAVANGLGDNLITRAALVTLKESRRLILVPRETPLGSIELENMLKLSRAGGIICPACPGFYMKPSRIDELIDFVVGRVLDLLDLSHDLNIRWDPASHPE